MIAWAALDPGRDDVRVAGVDDVEDLERLDAQLERVDRAAVYCASRMARGPKRAPGRWVTASSNGAPTIATSDAARAELDGSVIQGRFMNVGGPT